ncbi:MAG: hypothetical protein U1F54_13975 [Burkholderiales bacterium]
MFIAATARERWVLGLLGLLALAGCAGVSPTHVTADRMDYGQVVAESWKRQTLMNVVRMRYADAPMFLEVNSIINSYTLGGNANAQATIPRSAADVLQLGATANWSNTPTVTYQPLIGDRFTRSLLQPIPPVAVFQLLQGGWPVNLVFETVVSSVSGLRNAASGVAADPGFSELRERLSRIQRGGDIGIRIEPRKNGDAVVAVIRSAKAGTELNEDNLRIRELLGLPSYASEFEITYGLIPRHPSEVAMLTRSMMEIMLQLGVGVDIPAADSAKVFTSQWQPGTEKAKPLVHIRSGAEAPADAYAAVPYRGNWYWIEDTDIASKRTFTFLLILFSLAETGQSAAAPVVTVPSR